MISPFDGFMLSAHRGGLYYRPENSLAAFAYSLDNGIGWVECDVRLSKDLKCVLYHDEEVVFPHNGSKRVRELTSAELRAADIGGGEGVTTLDDAFRRFGGQLAFDVELKELDAVEHALDVIDRCHMSDRSMVTSFIPEALQAARDHKPSLVRGLLVDRLTGRIVRGRSGVRGALLLGCDYLLPHHTLLTPEWVVEAHVEGLKVVAWTVNRLDDAARLLDWGIDGIISDRPDYLKPLIREKRPGEGI